MRLLPSHGRTEAAARLAAAALLVVSGAAGCARQMVGTDVPLRRVVLYRNGVGYFERAGEIRGEDSQFRVRREHVGDFLATLAIIDSRGHARSVSFPSLEEVEPEACVLLDELEYDDDDDDELSAAMERCEEAREADDGLVVVTVELGGGDRHDLTVAYVVETPIWRPSYRVVMGEQGQALLQAWAVVQNLSGEDWTDVSMSVTSGAPLSFRSDLGHPIIPQRPTVTDRGEIVAAPVYSETALAVRDSESDDDGEYPEEEAMPASEPAPDMTVRRPSSTRSLSEASRSSGYDGLPGDSSGSEAFRFGIGRDENQQTIALEGLMGSVQSLAAGAVHEGVTRYDVTEPVTVPDSGSTMVAILNETIPGEDALLYRPDPAVPDSSTYPMRVVRMQNETGVLLERGPVAIYQTGALLGQGLMDPLPAGATTSIPFAIERAVAVTVTHETDRTRGRLVKIAGGRLTVEEFNQRTTSFAVRNGADRGTKLYVRHQRMTNWELVDPPEGTEQVEGAMLVPVALEARQDSELDIVERTPIRRVVDLLSDLGAGAVALYLEGPAVDAAAGPVLRQALEHRERLTEIQQRRARLNQERQELRNASSEARSNLEAIRTIARARDLRDRLTRRLDELSRRIDALTNQIVELDAEQSEMRVRLSEAIRDLSLDLDDDD